MTGNGDGGAAPGAGSLSPVTRWLSRQPAAVLTLYAMLAAFAAYTSMYAFRKPFTASSYEGLVAFSIGGVAFSYKSMAVISQLLGYMSSKFIGIKVASEASFRRRVPIVLGLIGVSELALVLFGLVPAPYNILCLFLNGLPLGMVWSLLFGLLEGRRITEFLGLGMSISVIFSSGWVKAVGRLTMERWQVSSFWMPALTGLIFVPLLLVSLWMLYHVPPPDAEDERQRSSRQPMDGAQRMAFFKRYTGGVVLLVLGYLGLMTYRDLRDSFMPDILAELGTQASSGTFATIESAVGLLTIVVLFGLWFFRNNRRAVAANMVLIGLGALCLGLATVALKAGWISASVFYLLNGIGLYVAFVPYQSILMDRLLASLRVAATASFLIAVADSFGYLSTVGLYLTRDVATRVMQAELPWSSLLMGASYLVMVLVPATMIGSHLYFRKRMQD